MPPRHHLPDDHPDNRPNVLFPQPPDALFGGLTEEGDPAFLQSSFFNDGGDPLDEALQRAAPESPAKPHIIIDSPYKHQPQHERPPSRLRRMVRAMGLTALT